jgi:lipopolysaccharide/colanic/teichoic acid biosynthesis glycosyltransferase
MISAFAPRTLVLFLGDLFFFLFALWASLCIRLSLQSGGLAVPTQASFVAHVVPFSLLFVVWVCIFFIAGLYESRSIVLQRRALSKALLVAQSINIALAALFFFFIPLPFFGIAPKTLLIIYLVVSFMFVLFWRTVLFIRLGLQKPEKAIAVGNSAELQEMVTALNRAHRAPATVVSVLEPVSISLASLIRAEIDTHTPRFVIADFNDPRVSAAFPELYNFLRQGIRFLDSMALYEDVFGRAPLSAVDERWIAQHISRSAHLFYDPLKRLIDVGCAFGIGLISLFLYPFIMFSIWMEDGGSPFVALDRVGEGGRVFTLYKFRSMSGNDQGNYGPGGTSALTVTAVGRHLRAWRLDELPQLWNVIIGDLSLIGPRPETPTLVATYEKEIPFYAVRHLIKPGLSGSAQLYYHGDPHHAADVLATKMKLSYDLFYLKHRSLSLDLSIFIKTIRRILIKSNA